MRMLCSINPSLSPLGALEMATLNGALALRRPRELGRIAPNARADLIALPIVPGAQSLYEEIIAYRRPVDWVMVNGQIV